MAASSLSSLLDRRAALALVKPLAAVVVAGVASQQDLCLSSTIEVPGSLIESVLELVATVVELLRAGAFILKNFVR